MKLERRIGESLDDCVRRHLIEQGATPAMAEREMASMHREIIVKPGDRMYLGPVFWDDTEKDWVPDVPADQLMTIVIPVEGVTDDRIFAAAGKLLPRFECSIIEDFGCPERSTEDAG